MRPDRRTFLHAVAAGATVAAVAPAAGADDLEVVGDWPVGVERVGLGPALWGNRLQDWRIRGGRLECVRAVAAWPMRTAHLLTRRLGTQAGRFETTVRLGLVEPADIVAADAAAGFLVGAGGATMDYRAAALVHHTPGPGGGLFAGISAAGLLFVRDFERTADAAPPQPMKPALPAEVLLRLAAEPAGDSYTLTLSAADGSTGRELGRLEMKAVAAARLVGNVALVSHPGTGGRAGRFAFRGWRLGGPKVERHPERTFGPILGTQYTLHGGVLKLTAQLMPVGRDDAQTVELQVEGAGGGFQTVARAPVVVPGYTATFRVEKWDSRRDVRYRVQYGLNTGGPAEAHFWDGTIRRDPADKPTLVLAALSCVQQVNGNVGNARRYDWAGNVWFPHADLVPRVAHHKPDLLFFAGDQIYEGNPTRPVRAPADESELDYLYKWSLWCWSYRDLTRDTPTVTIPDDHDVYHGNVWGAGGAAAAEGDPAGLRGGYGMPPRWVNMIQRTQTAHLPDPHDPAPAAQGIGVYYTALVWGGVGFAILEDRKFKSPPTAVGNVRMTTDSHILDKDYDTRRADVPGGQLLGERQERFLRAFAADWRGQVMKAALSQTIFCNLQISSRGETAGQLDKDLDSNGWPQSGRARALRELRRGFMPHIAGDQHLASLIKHGIDAHDDGPWSLCVPAVSNVYLRFWNPGAPPHTGRFEDGFHNRITVRAVANPVAEPTPGQFPPPVELHRKGVGYGVVRFDKPARTVTFEVWPRWVDPTDPKTGGMYPGWPVTVKQADNDGRTPTGWLPTLRIAGRADAVVRVNDESTKELVYALRVAGATFRPPVYAPSKYTVEVGDPDANRWEELRGVEPLPPGQERTVEVRLR